MEHHHGRNNSWKQLQLVQVSLTSCNNMFKELLLVLMEVNYIDTPCTVLSISSSIEFDFLRKYFFYYFYQIPEDLFSTFVFIQIHSSMHERGNWLSKVLFIVFFSTFCAKPFWLLKKVISFRYDCDGLFKRDLPVINHSFFQLSEIN